MLPQDWKTGYIVPIFKKGSKTNYRPVCLTSVVLKLLESIVGDALFSYISQNNLFSDSQHGFVPHRSCSTQLVHALNDWTSSSDKGFATDVIYFDFSKAFDSVPHVRLINKLKAYGVDGPLLKWFESFSWQKTMCSYKWYFIFLDTGQKRCPSGLRTWSIIILIICK